MPTAKPLDTTSNDGGAWSLLGYLYQLLGSAIVSLDSKETTPGETDAIIEVEEHGQDTTVTLAREIRLIQFKHSEGEYDIAPKELAAILETLEASEKAIDRRGKKVTWLLQTNRGLSPVAERAFYAKPLGNVGTTKPATIKTIQRLGNRLTIQRHTLQSLCVACVRAFDGVTGG